MRADSERVVNRRYAFYIDKIFVRLKDYLSYVAAPAAVTPNMLGPAPARTPPVVPSGPRVAWAGGLCYAGPP